MSRGTVKVGLKVRPLEVTSPMKFSPWGRLIPAASVRSRARYGPGPFRAQFMYLRSLLSVFFSWGHYPPREGTSLIVPGLVSV